jgi:TrmH family RNA methyltransferase
MGALFHLRLSLFESFMEYRQQYPAHYCYPFMVNGAEDIGGINILPPYALIFGNEAAGLDDSFADVGNAVRIPHSGNVDSLNLAVAAGIGLYMFTRFKK